MVVLDTKRKENLHNSLNGVRGRPDLVADWHKICNDSAQEEQEWVNDLRKQGYAFAHPDDGWGR